MCHVLVSGIVLFPLSYLFSYIILKVSKTQFRILGLFASQQTAWLNMLWLLETAGNIQPAVNSASMEVEIKWQLIT